MNIVDYIPTGKDNAVTKAFLIKITGLEDRALRKQIEIAREEVCICNDQDGKGYYIPDNKEDAERFLNQEKARATSVFKALRGTRNFIKEMEEAEMYGSTLPERIMNE